MPALPFALLQTLDLPLTEIVAGRIGFVHDAFLSFPYEVRDSLPEEERDLVVVVGKRRRPRLIEKLAKHPGRLVLLFAAGDGSVDSRSIGVDSVLPRNVVAAFAINNELGDRRLVSVPLGVRISNLGALQFVRQNHDRSRDGLLYGNFTVNDQHYRADVNTGARHIRARLADQLKAAPWARLEVSADRRFEPADLMRYYAAMAGHKFVLSPEGNGVDCYRTWEALYLGAIPIVMASAATSAFADLPILLTDDYSELSEEYLTQRWHEMSSRSFEIERMLKSWYANRFLEAVASLESPRFVCWQVGGSPSDKFAKLLQRSSRSASGVLIETPLPPFSDRGDLMAAEAWNTAAGMRVEQVGDGLRLVALGDGRAAAEIPLHTIAGAPFRLTGRVGAEAAVADPLAVELEARPPVIASAEIGASETDEHALELQFTARSERTVLTIRAPTGAKGGWLVRELALHADFQSDGVARG